jgi:hypothetical protein
MKSTRRYSSSATTLLMAVACGYAPAALAAQAVKTSDLIASLGINTHLNYTDGTYADYRRVIADLNYLGIHHLRDATPDPFGGVPYMNYVTALDAVANAGNRFDFVTSPSLDLGISLDQIATVERAHPGAVFAVEGPNEINNNPVSYNGQNGNAGATAYQRDLYSAVHASPVLQHAAVYYYTGFDDAHRLTGLADFANCHPYSAQGQQPDARIAAEFRKQFTFTPPYPKVITEAGYFDVPSSRDGVDDATQAKNTLNLYMDAFAQGVSETYVYQLLSAYPDHRSDTQSGLFRINHSPKPAAVAIHNLTTILADRGKRDFHPASLDDSVTNLPATGRALLLEKSSGSFDIVLWSEPANWNDQTHQEITSPPVSVTVTMNGIRANIAVYDPTVGLRPLQRIRDARAVTINLADHPVIIEVKPIPLDVATAGGSPLSAATEAD